MDEFDKIKELSDDIIGRKEPSFKKDEEALENEPKENLPDSPFLSDGPTPDDEMAEDDIPTVRWWLILLAAFIGFSAVALIGFFIFGREDQADKVITISATPEPVRVKPEEAGGISIPDQDKLVYTRTQGETPKVEKLFPEPEKPVMPELMLKHIDPILNEMELEETSKAEPTIIIEEEEAEPKKEVLPLPEKKVEKKPVVTKKGTTPAKKENGKWRIQLYSTPKKAMAEKTWTDVSQKQKALLSDMPHYVVAAEIAGKGTFYRLQAGQFSSKEQATALCAKLKAQKQDCIPVQAGK